MPRLFCILPIFLAACTFAFADSITAEGKTYDDVYVVEGGAMYYIHFPETGKVLGVQKNRVPKEQVRLTKDESQRKALRDQWNAKSDASSARNKQPAATPAAATALQMSAIGQAPAAPRKPAVPKLYVPAPKTPSPNGYVTDGIVRDVNLRDVPLGDALKGVLRPMNLTYKTEGNMVYISTPEKVRTESFEVPKANYYTPQSVAADTLPKIVVNNPAGGVGAQGAMGGVGGGGFGGAGYGGGVGGVGNVGGAGGYGGGGYGGGGYGGGGYGGGGGGTGAGFSNISDLFSTIDDRLVGEPPAVIGMGSVTVGRGNANYRVGRGAAGRRY